DDSADLVCLLLAADTAGVQVGIVSAGYKPQEIDDLARDTAADAVVMRQPIAGLAIRQMKFGALTGAADQRETPRLNEGPGVIIFTTGTTGRPKGAVYRWTDLLAQTRRRSDLEESVWLLLYRLN